MTPLPLSLGCCTVALGKVAASVSWLHNWSLKVVEQSCQVSSRIGGYLGNCWRTQPQIILANNIQYLFSPALWLLLRQSASSIKSCDIILKGNVLVLKWSGMYYDSLLKKKKSYSLTEIKHMTASWLKARKRIVWINHTCSVIPIPYFIRQWVPSYSFSDILQQK